MKPVLLKDVSLVGPMVGNVLGASYRGTRRWAVDTAWIIEAATQGLHGALRLDAVEESRSVRCRQAGATTTDDSVV